MYEAPVGLARVTDRASYYPYKFASFRRFNLPGVSDVPIGTFVLVLGQDANDKGWAPVVVNETLGGRKYARFTWMHPGCLEYLETGNDGPVVIGHTNEHGGAMATHDIGDWSPGVRRYNGQLVLDARWSGRVDTGDCKGYCTAFVAEVIRSDNRMADIFEFATRRESGIVACDFATHRSVAAGKVLELFFHRHVSYRAASENNCRCRRQADMDVGHLSYLARSLPSPHAIPWLRDNLHL